MNLAVYDSKEPVEFWLSQSTTIMGFITWTEHLRNMIVDDFVTIHPSSKHTNSLVHAHQA